MYQPISLTVSERCGKYAVSDGLRNKRIKRNKIRKIGATIAPPTWSP